MTLDRRTFILSFSSLPLARFARAQDSASSVRLIHAARKQIGITLGYDGAYKTLTYPNGDIPRASGVCTDVIVRAYRDAFNFDLQRKVHEDMTDAFSSYPDIWSLARPDRNIDHRRVPNLETYLARQQAALPLPGPNALSTLKPGELLTMRLPLCPISPLSLTKPRKQARPISSTILAQAHARPPWSATA